MVVVFDPIKNPSCTLTLRELNVSIKPAEQHAGEPDRLDVEGQLTGEHVGRIDLNGSIEPAAGRWSIGGHVESLAISPEFRAALPEHVADRLKEAAAVRGQVQLSFRLAGRDAKSPPRFEVDGEVSHGQVEDPRLPTPLTDLKADFSLRQRRHARDQLLGSPRSGHVDRTAIRAPRLHGR